MGTRHVDWEKRRPRYVNAFVGQLFGQADLCV
jgi:hypothetical protein